MKTRRRFGAPVHSTSSNPFSAPEPELNFSVSMPMRWSMET